MGERTSRGLGVRHLQVVELLQQDGRLSGRDIAKKINASAKSCTKWIRQLEDHGIIQGYRAIVDPELAAGMREKHSTWVLSPDVAIGFIILRDLNGTLFDEVKAFVASQEYAVAAWRLQGSIDYLIHVLAPDFSTLMQTGSEARDAIKDKGGKSETVRAAPQAIKPFAGYELKLLFPPEGLPEVKPRKKTAKMRRRR